MKFKAQHLPFILLSLVAMLLIYLCIYCPWLGDDIRYIFSFATGEPIKEFKDVIISQNAHYMNVNGRYVAHVLVQLFCGLSNHVVFAICNGLVFPVFVLITLRLAGVKFSKIALSILGISLCFVGFQTRMVPSCQIGYMWMFTLTMFVIWFFLHKPHIQKHWWWLLLPFCIIAGCGQEAVNVGVCGALIIYAWQHRKSMTATQWAIFFAYGFGALILVVSPGSHQRLTELHGKEQSTQVIYNIILFLKYVGILYVLAIVLVVGLISKRLNVWQCYKGNAFYWHIFLMCLTMNVFISIFGNRQLFGMELAALILTLRLLCSMDFGKLNVLLASVAMLLLFWVGYHNIKTVNAFSNDYEDMMDAYNASEDGIVFMDSRELSQPYPCKDICEEFLSEWGLSNINYMLTSNPNNRGKKLTVLPTAFNPLPTSSAYAIDSNNNLFVICNANKISGFSVMRHKVFLGQRLSRNDYEVNINDEPPLYRIGNMVVYIQSSATWNKVDTVMFIPKY